MAIASIKTDGVLPNAARQMLSTELRHYLSKLPPDRFHLVDSVAAADVRIDTVLRNADNGLSADVRFTELPSGRQVWAETFHASGEPVDFPLEVAVRLTKCVIYRYIPQRPREERVRTDVSPSALALFREAEAMRNSPLPQLDHQRAVVLLGKAVAEEPRFVEAWSALSDIWTIRSMFWKGPSQSEALRQARQSTDRAIELDRRNALALNNRGLLLMLFDRDFRKAETALRAAIAADPTLIDARLNFALLLSALGNHDEAVAQARQVQILDPALTVPSPLLAYVYLMGGRYGDSYAEYRATLASCQRPKKGQWGMASAALAAGRWDDAARAFSAALEVHIEIPADAGDRGEALREQLRRIGRQKEVLMRADLDPYSEACFHAQTGDVESAFVDLDRAAQTQTLETMFALNDPRLGSIRGDPRYVDYLVRVGLAR